MKNILSRLNEALASLFCTTGFTCPVCGREAVLGENGLCSACAPKVRRIGSLPASVPLCGLYANYAYDPILRPAMHRLKYKQQSWLAVFFMDGAVLPEDITFDAIVPVPMHPIKEYFRAYNPPEALAIALAKRYPEIPIRTDLLKKTRLTRSQTTLHKDARTSNVKDVFRASKDVQGLTILLIDDVTTTGSTLLACANALKAQGADKIYALAACKAIFGEEAPEELDEA